jgi:hypothetical protein
LAEKGKMGQVPKAITEKQRVVVQYGREKCNNHLMQDTIAVYKADKGKTRQLRVGVVVLIQLSKTLRYFDIGREVAYYQRAPVRKIGEKVLVT